ncbi:hypothetical protein [Kallotenue papyrolyticum]|uniref:hypothetical protein n=1 Tax=Kallotenue papyrolyticum TaxID=1325125 RepID=UPI000492E14C|nr:hypothetical protein [Kallotenue papyrolyticum]
MAAPLPIGVLLAGALVLWLLHRRVRTWTAGGLALATILLALGGLVPQLIRGPLEWSVVWGVLDGRALLLRLTADGATALLAPLVLVCGATVAGGLMWTLGRAATALTLSFVGLLLLLAGDLIVIASPPGLGSILGLGLAWLGMTVVQQPATAHVGQNSFGGLTLLLLTASAWTMAALTPDGRSTAQVGWWLLGALPLMLLGPRWSSTRAAPLLVRAPATALGLPLLGATLLTQQALATAADWPPRLVMLVVLAGVGGLALGALNALAARTLSDAFAWQVTAQLALIAVVFGTGRPEAGPMALGLLAHAAVTTSAMALAIGQLERVTRHEAFGTMPPLPQPLRRAGLAYGLAALSCAGLPPLLGYALRRVVVVLAGLAQPWLPPLMLALSTLLALSYLPTLVVFFRRPLFRSSIRQSEQRGGGWPLLLMLGLLLAGLIPDVIWQWLLGDPAVPQAVLPGAAVWRSTAITATLTLIVFGLVNRALRRPRPVVPFSGGEPIDEEPGWALPFAALRQIWRPLLVPTDVEGPLRQVGERARRRLTRPLLVLERRYYLVIVVIGLIAVLLLAVQYP